MNAGVRIHGRVAMTEVLSHRLLFPRCNDFFSPGPAGAATLNNSFSVGARPIRAPRIELILLKSVLRGAGEKSQHIDIQCIDFLMKMCFTDLKGDRLVFVIIRVSRGRRWETEGMSVI